ncbi:hypothetical protein NW762_006118 [Fusarium torreyae]|uniref:Major facilitator superfamily (MFS) profile domain-containing protein n=1 Tax=Fusarium torreyae TaxID=1237075 RepID=A0A9W8VHA1_9HYPO|nr:hypothetical protein NW762_006118 [Fusarium torreyae]
MISSEKPEIDQISYSGGEGPNMQKANQEGPQGPDNTNVVLTVDAGNMSSLKLAHDGKTVLHPQPTEDINDPLNWPSWKKHAILFTTSWGAFTADYTAAAGSATVVNQAVEWHQSVSKVNETNSINVLMMWVEFSVVAFAHGLLNEIPRAVGGILWVPLTSVFGRAPTLFWSSIIALGVCVGTAVVDDFPTFYALRALLGFFTTSVQTTSIALIYDLFFFHQRARKVGLWALLYIGSPLWGPLVGNFVMGGTGEWRNVCWVSVAVCGFYVCLIVAFLDETWYNRSFSTFEQPARHSNFISRLSRITGVWQVHNRLYYEKVNQAYKRFARTVIKPALFLVLVS